MALRALLARALDLFDHSPQPLRKGLLHHLADFTALVFGPPPATMPPGVTPLRLPANGLAAQRYGAQAGDIILIRPDQHIAARWHHCDPETIDAARRRALCLT